MDIEDDDKPHVYVVQDLGKISLLPAEKYGELVVCLDRPYSHKACAQAHRTLRDEMSDITSADFLLPIGSPAYIAFAGALMKEYAGIIRVLQWDRNTQQYFIQEVQ